MNLSEPHSHFIGDIIKIHNIGKIQNAEVKLNGLTLIAGENDTGKSTVGKLIFSIIKAISRYEEDLGQSKEAFILEKVEKLYFKLRRLNRIDTKLANAFKISCFIEGIRSYEMIGGLRVNLFGGKVENRIDVFFANKKSIIENSELENNDKIELYAELEEIKQTILQKYDTITLIKNALQRALYSEFYSEISPKGRSVESFVSYTSGNTVLVNIEIAKNKVQKLSLQEELLFKDAIYIETPLVLQLYDLLKVAGTLYESNGNNGSTISPKVALHLKDLMIKIENAKYYADFDIENENTDLLNTIGEIINGGFNFDNEFGELRFSQKTGEDASLTFKPTNTASGIKSFGLIQLLLQANMLKYNSLLIIDEPENHLHPKWQIAYAKMIVELVKNDITVLISSHSPYMIQALKYYSEKAGLSDKSNFYFAEVPDNEHFATISDVTNNLNVIFSKLAEPLTQLVWQ